MTGRATPLGLAAGVAVATFGGQPRLRWGRRHHAVASPAATWLDEVIQTLESCPELLARLPVVANTTMTVRGDRLVIPDQPRRAGQLASVDAVLRLTTPVRVAVEAARAPIRMSDLAAKVREVLPSAPAERITALLAELVSRRALITSLHAPSTTTDALAHLVEQVDAADGGAVQQVADLVAALHDIRALMSSHNGQLGSNVAWVRDDLAATMRMAQPCHRHPLALDLRLDATVVLPESVAREVERAALLLTRLSAYPFGRASWRDYHMRFYERYGIGSMAPLRDVIDTDAGIGWPDGYPAAAAERHAPAARRDELLLSLAQAAALDGRREVILDAELLDALDIGTDQPRLPPHLELCVRVHARDQQALIRGDFRVEVVSVSRGTGTLCGRFLQVLTPDERQRLSAELADLPTADADTVPAQLSFAPLDPAAAHVARAPRILPTVISLAEHRSPDPDVLSVEDLAVACDGRRMYLAAPARGQRIEATSLHALNPTRHTPSLARFLIELSRAQYAQVTAFDWGAAAKLPYLPRLRHGRVILAPATWRLPAADLPPRERPWSSWDDAFAAWSNHRRLPRRVYLAEGDQRLPLDLAETAHRVLLRTHLGRHPHAVLLEAPDGDSTGWCEGRPHEVIVPLKATVAPAWPRLPKPTPARLIGRDQGKTPGASLVMLAKLYGDRDRQDELLAEHLPRLLARWETVPPWWFLRFRDPDQHLRLRIALPHVDAFGPTAQIVSAWADQLRRAGLLREVQYATSYPETGRWGSEAAMDAAEAVFRADSATVVTQLRQYEHPHQQALVAAHTAAIAVGFTGSTEAGMKWLIDHIPAAAPGPVDRAVFAEAVRIADPRSDWATLRAAPGGTAIVDAWQARAQALAAYRRHLPGPHTEGVDPDDVLGSLAHAHFIRAVGVDFDDEAICLYLARSAALAWTARATAGRS
ncbi:lantibiotic dehydratase [Catellatospora sp. NPDC049609]|uniref:lantibiotic dehydratase n=1 Tax=Catellatospora sp. NPDC049609 TaxID=3155505 RepID=UPI00342B44DF